MFSVIIFIHELGHFVVARLCGVRVVEFSLGMGPALIKHQGKETLYVLRLLPIGGYAAMEGENGEFGEYENSKHGQKDNDDNSIDSSDEDTIVIEVDGDDDIVLEVKVEDETARGLDVDVDVRVTVEDTVDGTDRVKNPRSFSDKTPFQKILICVAGPVMNLVLAFVLLVCVLWEAESFGTNTISSFKENSSTNLTGLRQGDTITKINGVSISTDMDIVYEVLRDHDHDGIFDMQVIRDGNKLNLEGVTFQLVDPQPNANGEIDPNATPSIFFDFYVESDRDLTFTKKLQRGLSETYSLSRTSILSVVDLIGGRVAFSELSGPVGVGQVVGQAVGISLSTVLNLAAMISVSIGIFNLLPFPALDGGRIVFYSIEGITGKPINPKVEGYVNGVGMLILLTLMIAVTFKDIVNLF